MSIIIIRMLLGFYVGGILGLLLAKATKKTSSFKGVLAIIFFPLLLLTKKGRNNLRKD